MLHRKHVDAKGNWVSYRPDIKILDCTIRDGGLVNDHKFDESFVKAVYETCVAAGVDYCELGYKGARRLFAAQWRMLAQRYRGVAADALSFNLVNEPPAATEDQYLRVATAAVDAIRNEDTSRLIIADGRGGGREPTPLLARLKIAQAGRGYEPFAGKRKHYGAPEIEFIEEKVLEMGPHSKRLAKVVDRCGLTNEN